MPWGPCGSTVTAEGVHGPGAAARLRRRARVFERDPGVQQVVTGLVFALVPALAGHRVVPTVLVLLAAPLVQPRVALALLAFALPTTVGLPWPTHCLTAWVAWVAWAAAASRRGQPARERPGTARRPATQVPLVLLALLGTLSGAATVAIARDAIHQMVLPLPLAPPGPAVLALLVVAAAAVNALGEELIWRRLLPAAGPGLRTGRTVLVQALSFGVAHWHGIPSGPWGAVCAGVYSIVVYAVWRVHGFWAALFVHAITDIVIFWYVVHHAGLAWSG